MLSSAKIRSSQGCWTCRLRRKKCDEQRPVCSVCATLEITCFYGDQKPAWMDGGEQEKEMAERLKTMVKTKASERREKKWASGIYGAEEPAAAVPTDSDTMLSQDMAQYKLDSGTEHEAHDTSGSSSYTPGTSATGDSPAGDRISLDAQRANIQPLDLVTDTASTTNNAGLHMTPYHTKALPDVEAERELGFSMMYLDYVFPYMSPFYRPPLLQGGRGWLLVLLMRNKPLYHTALSLASYYFSVIVGESVLGHESCQESSWKELQKQQELSIQSLHRAMQRLTSQGVANSFADAIHCLESIVQMLSFDATIGISANWQMHLEAAITLFEQILDHHALDPVRPWYSVLAGMDSRSIEIHLPRGEHPWSSDQASFRFLTMHLLWTDILAATALNRAPRLDKFHQQLLVGEMPDLQASDFIGCHNWVMLIIGQIALLQGWKKEMKRSGSLSMVDLVKKGSCIENRLRQGIAQLDAVPMDLRYDPSARAPDQPFAGSGFEPLSELGKFQTTAAQAFQTKIWAKAALIFVSVVVSGFQPALPEIRINVVETMELFRLIPSPLCLRTLVWPFAVTGCLALPGDENFFLGLVSDMGSMKVFGTVKEAQQILKTVWEHRACIDSDIWDIAACLNTLGHSSLLV